MSVEIREVKTKKDVKQFVDFQFQLYKGSKYWVPALKSDEINSLLPEKNPAFDFCEAKFWLAYKNGKCVGRIGGVIIPMRNEKMGEKIGRFTRPEFIDDEQVADALFSTVISWVKSKGMHGIQGPLGFSNLDHAGLMIEGFDYLPSVASDYHAKHYKKHYERYGFEKEMDWLEFRIKFPEELSPKAVKINEMVKRRYEMRSLEFTDKKTLEPYKYKIFEVFNEAFRQLFGTFEFPEKLQKFYADKYFPMLNPNFVKLMVDKNGKLVAFVIGLPSLSVAMQKAKGKLFPFGWYYIKKALEQPKEIDLMLTGVLPEYQSKGLVAVLSTDIWKTAQEYGIKYVETTGMLENNTAAIGMWRAYDHIQHKRKRSFRKMFN